MNCREFDARIHGLLDEDEPLSCDSHLLGHAAVCPRCATELASYQGLFERMARLQPPNLDAEFSHRVVRMAFPVSRSSSAGSGQRNESRYIAPAVLACLVLLAALPWLRSITVRTGTESRDTISSIAPDSEAIDSHQRGFPRIDSLQESPAAARAGVATRF